MSRLITKAGLNLWTGGVCNRTAGISLPNEDDSLWIVSPGEIYDYCELRALLLGPRPSQTTIDSLGLPSFIIRQRDLN